MRLTLPSPSLIRERVASSLWLVPGLIITGSAVVALALVELDTRWESVFAQWPRLFGAGPDGARILLSTVAGSMITVAGVVFSITLVALSLTSSQYSSRVLRNFMRSRINQAVLGIFLGIFTYCLVVLRTVREFEDGAFVPPLALAGGLLLGLVGVLVLVYFIHYLSTAIQASQILATVFDETMGVAERILPDDGELDPADEDLPSLPSGPGWTIVRSQSTGYLEAVGVETLMGYACEHERVLWVMCSIGSFVTTDVPMLAIGGATVDDEAERRLRGAFAVSRHRTLAQDIAFGVRQLVDVALKALSPGINDTTTAVMSVDYLGAVLRHVAPRRIDVRKRDDDGELRVVLRPTCFSGLVADAFDQIREIAAGNAAVLRRMLGAIKSVGEVTVLPQRREVLVEQLDAVRWSIDNTVSNPEDRQRLLRQADDVRGELTRVATLDALPSRVASAR